MTKEQHAIDEKIINPVRSLVESCIQGNPPVIILGSGASAPYGIHTMDQLADHIIATVEDAGVDEEDQGQWDKFKESIKSTGNLERSLEIIENSPNLMKDVSYNTWKVISDQDASVFKKLINEEETLGLSDLIKIVSNGHSNNKPIEIITTNYDRLAEYACDTIEDSYNEYLHYTGFSYGLVRKPDEAPKSSSYNMHRRAWSKFDLTNISKIKPVEILKVHGSIDWFEYQDNRVVAIPTIGVKPKDTVPAIITPGNKKYRQTHLHPYSMILSRTREALDEASSYFTIGFGFRDEHVHSNLERKLKKSSGQKTFVVLAKELTQETKGLFLSEGNTHRFALFEQDGDNTRIYFRDSNYKPEDPIIIENTAFWDLKEFIKFFLVGR